MTADEAVNAATNREVGDAPRHIVPLSEHDELEIATGYPDVRGWDVRDFNGRSVGYVYDLLVDETRVWYFDVLVDPEFAGNEPDPRVLIPVERAGLDGSSEAVLLRGIDAVAVRALVPYAAGRVLSREPPDAARAAEDTRSDRPPQTPTPIARPREERMDRVINDRLRVVPRRPPGNGGAQHDTGARESVAELFKRLSGDASHLVQQEVALAKIELREAGTTLARDATKIGIGVGLALPGVFALTAFLVIALGDLLDNYWLAALIVGAVFVAVGAIVARNAVADIKRRGLTPEATLETVREDAEWAGREMRELKEHVRS